MPGAGVPEIFLGAIGSPLGSALRRQVEDWSVPAQFQDFGTGVITLSGLFYFIALTVAMLYLNMVLLGRRHWAGSGSMRKPCAAAIRGSSCAI